MYRTEFFADLDTDYVHDGSTRKHWVADRIEEILAEPHDGQRTLRSASAD